jgi:hypothetical protein
VGVCNKEINLIEANNEQEWVYPLFSFKWGGRTNTLSFCFVGGF